MAGAGHVQAGVTGSTQSPRPRPRPAGRSPRVSGKVGLSLVHT